MQNTCLLPLAAAPRRNVAGRMSTAEIVTLPADAGKAALRDAVERGLECATPADDSSDSDGNTVALLCAAGAGDTKAWFLIPRTGALGVNGVAPPLPLVQVDPGTLLTLGGRGWLVVSVREPRPAPAPPELADRDCPVCGGRFALAPVAQCGCGRWTHLERPEEPESRDALNCFLAAPECPDCGRAATLQAQITPEPSEKLVPTEETP